MTSISPLTITLDTPSKPLAAGLDALELTKPKNPFHAESSAAASTKVHVAPVDDELKRAGRDRFVGNPEILSDKDEPLLKASAQRFVLFPIKYHEVSLPFCFCAERVASPAARSPSSPDARLVLRVSIPPTLTPSLFLLRPQIWQFYKKAEASFWTAEEMDLSKDMVRHVSRYNALAPRVHPLSFA